MIERAVERNELVIEQPAQCVTCDYVLAGLPVGCACPECGQMSPPVEVVLHDVRRGLLWVGIGSAILLGYVLLHLAPRPGGSTVQLLVSWVLLSAIVWMPAVYAGAVWAGAFEGYLHRRLQILPAGRLHVNGLRRTFMRWQLGGLIHVWRDEKRRLWVAAVMGMETAEVMLGPAAEGAEETLITHIHETLNITPHELHRPRVTRTRPYYRRSGRVRERETATPVGPDGTG